MEPIFGIAIPIKAATPGIAAAVLIPLSRAARAGPLQMLVLLLLSLAPPTALGQQPGADLGIDAARLPNGTDSLAIFLIRGGDTIRTGTLWDELRVLQQDGEARLRRVYRSRDRVLGVRVDTIADEFPSLSPVLQRSRSSRGAEFLDFSGEGVQGWMVLANGDSVQVKEALPERVYGASSFDLILRSAPLEDDWQVEVPAFLPSTRTVVPLRARVSGLERVGARACWRVEADFAGSAVTFWIAQGTRVLCRQVMHLRPGVQLLFETFPDKRGSGHRSA